MINSKGKMFLMINLFLVVIFLILWRVPFSFGITHHLITDNYGFYTQSRSEWAEDKSILNRIYANALDLKLRNDWKNHVLKRLDKIGSSDLEKSKFVVNLTKSLNADIPHIPVPQSLFGSLVHGFGHCDELNGTVAFIMHGLVDKSELFALWDKKNKRSQHSVARIETDEIGIFYLDAYKKNVPYFGIEEELTKKGQILIPNYNDISKNLGLSKELYLDGKMLSSYSFFYQVNKAFNRISSMIKKSFFLSNINNSQNLLGSIFGLRSAMANETNINDYTNNKSILKLYLSARVHHMYGKLSKAKNLYNEIILTECSLNECIASSLFHKKLSN
jgi:hypothetical protein